MFYRKSNFAKWGVSEPKTWDDFLDLCDKLKSKGIPPIGLGAGGNTAWVASAWFDYLDIRINGAPYHRELLAGQHRFDDPEVRKVFDRWQEVLPYFDPNGTAGAFQDATTALLQGRSGMMLIGTFFADAAPKDALDDIDFFRFPVIDPKVPVAEEGPTDGYFASARTGRRDGVLDVLGYLATAEAQEMYIKGSSGTVLPCHPDAKDSGTPLVKKGRAQIEERGRDHPVLQPRLQRRPPAHRRHRADQVPRQAQGDREHPHRLAARGREDLEGLTWPS